MKSTKPKIYRITLSRVTYVAASSVDEAKRYAIRDEHEMLNNEGPGFVSDAERVTKLDDLTHGWKGNCIPYGDADSAFLSDLLSRIS